MCSIKTQKYKVSRPLQRGRLTFTLACLMLTSLLLGIAPLQTPKNDPPRSPLIRSFGKIYAVSIKVENKLNSTGWPILPETNWCEIDLNSLTTSNQNGGPIEHLAVETKDPQQWQLQMENGIGKLSLMLEQ